MVKDNLTLAKEYGYSEVPLESTIKWRPMVLILGNYSSGKSTLINEFLGADIQAVGQAPTDDSFTIITYDETIDDSETVHITQERTEISAQRPGLSF
ncbi:MAG: dynamin family protein [Desulfobacterales bacterium]